ncbi:Beta-1,4-mannosyltransferase egh [Portunus trituberculatus]|uniref:Beta-1,4-mannosyltransferase egh n=1 Tax=Portunus trituberculatus TaxID=210409 RepID=A0A5B7I9W8_PORTR|nr:Beta-1,4-mannosyltransferase egh [Portunus trituberculatus]
MVVSWVSSAFSEKLHTTKHVAHVCLLLIVVFLFEVGAGGLWGGTPTTAAYPPLVTLLFQLLRLLPLLALPQAVFNFLGFICFNAFPERAKLKGSPLLAPFLCLRVVTRGDYPDLVRTNVNRNLNTCLRVGLEKFMIEVVTDKKIDLPENQRIRQVSQYICIEFLDVMIITFT